MTTAPLQIDIVSDVMCPWCVVGYKQLAAALDATGTPHELRWHPFELNPAMPPQGQNIREHLAQKYGSSKAQSDAARARLTQVGAQVGFEFRFTDAQRMHNTFNTHQLLHWAGLHGRTHDLKMALFSAHFTHGRDLSDDTVLADIAAEIGLDRADALQVLADQRFAEPVREAEQAWVAKGIRSVPGIVFNGRHLVSGAQGVETFTRVLERLAALDSQSA